MSKESYIRGFCKVAEACGVDPAQLAKCAASNNGSAVSGPKYKTEGYTPEFFNVRRSLNIPSFYSDDGKARANRCPVGWSIVRPHELKGVLPDTPEERVRQIVNPRRLAWVQAHTNALSKATAPLREAGFPEDSTRVPDDIQRAIEKIYHDTMKSTTSAVPAQVSAPVKR